MKALCKIFILKEGENLKADKRKLAMAAACMNTEDLQKVSGMPWATINEGRICYDAFVLENKAKAIYYQAKSAAKADDKAQETRLAVPVSEMCKTQLWNPAEERPQSDKKENVLACGEETAICRVNGFYSQCEW